MAAAEILRSIGCDVVLGQGLDRDNEDDARMVAELFARHERMCASISRRSEETVRMRSTMCMQPVSADFREKVKEELPQTKVYWARSDVVEQAEWETARELTNQLMTHDARMNTDSFVHYGGKAMSYVTAGIDNVQLCVDARSSIALCESVDDDREIRRLMAPLPPERLFDQVGSTGVRCHLRDYVRSPIGNALIVDGGMYAMDPEKFFSTMRSHGSSIGYYALPHHPKIWGDTGGLAFVPNLEVAVGPCNYLFKYGTVDKELLRFPIIAWHAWLRESERLFDDADQRYQIDIIDDRFGFYIFRVSLVNCQMLSGDVSSVSSNLAFMSVPSVYELMDDLKRTSAICRVERLYWAAWSGELGMTSIAGQLSVDHDPVVELDYGCVDGSVVIRTPFFEITNLVVLAVRWFGSLLDMNPSILPLCFHGG